MTVAGIALSSVMFSACGPKDTLQGEPSLPPEPDTAVTVTDTVPQDTLSKQLPSPDYLVDVPIMGEIVEYSDLGFPPEFGTPSQWVESQIQDSVLRSLIGDNVRDVIVEFTTDNEGFVDDVSFYNLPKTSKGNVIKRELEAIIRNMPRWDTTQTTTRHHHFVINPEK